jgi:hypothetical protein
MLFYVVGVTISHTNSVVFKIEKGGELQQVGGWDRRFGLEKGIKGGKVSRD